MRLFKGIDTHRFSIPPKAGMAIILPLLLLAGCFPSSKAPELVEQFTLEYRPPAKISAAPVPVSLKVDRFSVNQTYNNTSMVYRPSPYRLAVYGYTRWRANPGDLITDFLTRDIRNSGIFLGVFTYRDTENARFVIEGGVEEFLEDDEGAAGKAAICLSVSFIDTSEKELTKRLVFQKTYRAAEPLTEQSSRELARGMSVAVKTVSGLILNDVSEALRLRHIEQ
ncbi:MAG TPA: ABC-type transport auxiliary lipoprotein family protein [Syntrophorhabdaceae bacterium]|jgi:cholesterol transport system auxiliary component